MDEQKDIRTSDILAGFFSKPALRSGLLSNQPADRLYRRAERVVGAVFLATNHIEPSETVRISARSAALEMLEKALMVRDEIRSAHSESVNRFKTAIRFNISLVRMLTMSGFLSLQNATVLVEALDDLAAFFSTAQHSPLSESVPLSKQDFLDIGTQYPSVVKDKSNVKDIKNIKDNKDMSDKTTKRTSSVRKQAIIEVLRTGGELGIVDISSNLPEYSTKMIQRELADLVATGGVKKTGLKRWSRYSLMS